MRTKWLVIVDYWTGEWTYASCPDYETALWYADQCSPDRGEVKIRRVQ